MGNKHNNGKKFSFGHLSSQKFAGMVFCVAVLFAGATVLPIAAFGNLVMGVTALYAAFVGGRAYSDGQALKFGGTVTTNDTQVSTVTRLPAAPEHAPAPKAPQHAPVADDDEEID